MRSAPRAGQTRIPDWVWGGALGLIVIVAIGGYFLLSGGGGGGGGRCDQALAPIGTSDISQKGFDDEDAGLADLIQRLQAGDRNVVDSLFYVPGSGGSSSATHAFTHNVDEPLRAVDLELAKKLCSEVYKVEDVIAFRGSNSDFLASLVKIREYLQEAAVALGYVRPAQTMEIDVPAPGSNPQGVQYARST